jgi:hypothetical protein
MLRKAALLTADTTRSPGYCQTTPEGFTGDCTNGDLGNWALPRTLRLERSHTDLEDVAAYCRRQCHRCDRCQFISYSAKHKDCSWFHACPADPNTDVKGFFTELVKHSAERNVTRGSSEFSPSVRWRHLAPARAAFSSQAGQDWCLINQVFRHRRRGFYLDLAANDAIHGSNTYALDRQYAWSGLCIEPQEMHQGGLAEHRTCTLAQTAVGSGEPATFSFDPQYDQLSGVAAVGARKSRYQMIVPTVPLARLLAAAQAPRTIDYFSLDCEGCERQVLEAFPWALHEIGALTVERPGAAAHALLRTRGYCAALNFFALTNADILYLSAAYANATLAACAASLAHGMPEYISRRDLCGVGAGWQGAGWKDSRAERAATERVARQAARRADRRSERSGSHARSSHRRLETFDESERSGSHARSSHRRLETIDESERSGSHARSSHRRLETIDDGAANLNSTTTMTTTTTWAGYCAITSPRPGNCERGHSGSWAGVVSVGACMAKCADCTRCRFVSFSRRADDCSWYARCDTSRLLSIPQTYVTQARPGRIPLPPRQGWRARAPRLHAKDRLSWSRSSTGTYMRRGYCALTLSAGNCRIGDSGTLPLQRTLEGCERACTSCERCAVISWSRSRRDCSWYARCGLRLIAS